MKNYSLKIKINKKAFFFIIVCFLTTSSLFAEEIHQNLHIWFEHKESVQQNPYYPNCITTDYSIYIHWSPPADTFCHYGIYKDGSRIAAVDKSAAFYQIIAFGGGWCGVDLNDAYSKYKAWRDYQLESYYNHSFKIEANRSCLGLPSIVDEVLVKKSALPNPTKEVPKDKITTVGEPINVASGNMFISHTDISIPLREIPLELTRAYNSGDDSFGQFGYGWRSNFDITLSEQADMSVREVDETGVFTIYTRDMDGVYTPSAGKYSLLTKNPDGTYIISRKHGRRLYFDAQGRLTKIEGRNGNAINIQRSANGAVFEVADPSGRKLFFTNDMQGRTIQITDAANRIFKYDYDGNGNLIKVTDPLDNVTTYQYNADHKLTLETDSLGRSLNFEYDPSGRAYHSWQDNNNNEITLSFDEVNQTTTVTDSRGNLTEYEYNTYGLVTKITDSQNNAQIIAWDANLNKISFIDQNHHTTTYNYDSRGNLLSVTDPLSNTTVFTYEPNFEFIKTVTDAQGNLTAYDYDLKGNLIKLTDALGNFTANTYDDSGQLVSTTDPRNNTAVFNYNTYSNLSTATDALGNTTTFTYDILGNRTQTKDAKNNLTKFKYNNLNQLIEITNPDNSVTTYAYDAFGNKTSFTDTALNTTTYTYNLNNQLASVTNPLGKTITLQYDTQGNRTKAIDQSQNETTYQYDSLNRPASETNPLGLSKSYTYDPAGNHTSVTDAKGNTITYEYDSLNRLKKIKYPDDNAVSFEYDSLGRRIAMIDSQGTASYTYDNLGRLIQVDGPKQNDTLQYTYDETGNRTSLILPDGKTVTYTYDALNRISSITDPNNKTTTYAYNEAGNPARVIYPNNTQAVYTFDVLHRLTCLTNQKQDDPQDKLSEFIYTYDQAGRRSRIESLDGITDYTYDALGELTGEIKSSITTPCQITYEYDPSGNRIRMLKNNTEHLYAYNNVNQLTQEDISGPAQKAITVTGTVSDANGIQSIAVNGINALLEGNSFTCSINLSPGSNTITATATDNAGNIATKTVNVTYAQTDQIIYLYDNNGNLIKKQSSTQELNLSYDYENRLTQELSVTGTVPEFHYDYDGEGRRISSTNGSGTINYLYDGLDVVLERSGSGDPVVNYLRNPNAAGGIGGIINSQQGPNPENYYSYDGLGSVSNLSGISGTNIQSYSYDAFGNTLTPVTLNNIHQFLTKEADPSGFIYFGHRYYDPAIGRFITPDPLGMIDGPNVYLYAGNDPVNLVDLYGLCTEKSWWEDTKDKFKEFFGIQTPENAIYFNLFLHATITVIEDGKVSTYGFGPNPQKMFPWQTLRGAKTYIWPFRSPGVVSEDPRIGIPILRTKDPQRVRKIAEDIRDFQEYSSDTTYSITGIHCIIWAIAISE